MTKKETLLKIIAWVLIAFGLGMTLYVSVAVILSSFISYQTILYIFIYVVAPISLGMILLIHGIHDTDRKYKLKRWLIAVLFVLYLMILIAILFRARGYISSELSFLDYYRWNTNFIPLKTIIGYVHAYLHHTINESSIIQNLAGNLLLFTPMGIFLPCLFKRLRTWGPIILSALLLPAVVELLQLIFRNGQFDVDDILLNMLGMLIAFALWRLKPIQILLTKMYVIKTD